MIVEYATASKLKGRDVTIAQADGAKGGRVSQRSIEKGTTTYPLTGLLAWNSWAVDVDVKLADVCGRLF